MYGTLVIRAFTLRQLSYDVITFGKKRNCDEFLRAIYLRRSNFSLVSNQTKRLRSTTQTFNLWTGLCCSLITGSDEKQRYLTDDNLSTVN